MQELQNSVIYLTEQNLLRIKENKQLRESHLETYDRLEVIEETVMTHEETMKSMLKQMSKDSKSFHLQIVKQNNEMKKLEVITQQNQRNIEANQLDIKANQQNIEANQGNIQTTIEGLLLAMNDLQALRRDQTKVIEQLFKDQ